MKAVLALILSYVFIVTSISYAATSNWYYYRPNIVDNPTKELKDFYRKIPKLMKVKGRRPSIEGRYASNVMRQFGYVVWVRANMEGIKDEVVAREIMIETGSGELLDYIHDTYTDYFVNGKQKYRINNENNSYLIALQAAMRAYNTDYTDVSVDKEVSKEDIIDNKLRKISKQRGFF